MDTIVDLDELHAFRDVSTRRFSVLSDVSSVGTSYSEFDGFSQDNDLGSSQDDDFSSLLEDDMDPLGPFVREEVKDAVLIPLSMQTVKNIWGSDYSTVMEGMLFKKGRAQKHLLMPRHWKRRYFKLSSTGELSYYKNHHLKGKLFLTNQAMKASGVHKKRSHRRDENDCPPHVRLCAGTSFRTCIEPKTGRSNSTEWRFSIRTDSKEIVLAARTKNEMHQWLSVIHSLCEAHSSSVDLIMNLEIEVYPKSLADLAVSSPRTIAASLETGESEQKRAHTAPLPFSFGSDIAYFSEQRTRAISTPVLREIFPKTKGWNERDGVLRVIRINDVPPTVYQPKYTMKLKVRI